MGEMVIACYRPKPGKDAELLDLVRGHVPVVQRLWERFMLVSDFGTLSELPGSGEPFPHFDPVDF
jgi:hypothetical protein